MVKSRNRPLPSLRNELEVSAGRCCSGSLHDRCGQRHASVGDHDVEAAISIQIELHTFRTRVEARSRGQARSQPSRRGTGISLDFGTGSSTRPRRWSQTGPGGRRRGNPRPPRPCRLAGFPIPFTVQPLAGPSASNFPPPRLRKRKLGTPSLATKMSTSPSSSKSRATNPESLRVRLIHAGRLRDIDELAAPDVPVQDALRSREADRRTRQASLRHRLKTLRIMFQIDPNIAAHEQIEQAVVVVIQERGAGTPVWPVLPVGMIS